MAVRHRTAVCLQIQCHLRLFLVPSIDAHMDADVMADHPCRSSYMLLSTEHISVQFQQADAKHIRELPPQSVYRSTVNSPKTICSRRIPTYCSPNSQQI